MTANNAQKLDIPTPDFSLATCRDCRFSKKVPQEKTLECVRSPAGVKQTFKRHFKAV